MMIGIFDVEVKILVVGLEFVVYGMEEYFKGSIVEVLNYLSKFSGLVVFCYIIILLKDWINVLFWDVL